MNRDKDDTILVYSGLAFILFFAWFLYSCTMIIIDGDFDSLKIQHGLQLNSRVQPSLNQSEDKPNTRD